MDLANIHAVFRPNQTGLKKVLGDLEAEIMEVVWSATNPMSGKDVHLLLSQSGGPTHQTIVGTMTALAEKDLLKVVFKNGKTRFYLPSMSREDFLHHVLGHVLDNLLGEFPDALCALLDERRQVSGGPGKLGQLRERVRRLEGEEDAR
ncbi:BlaI/MecI/CopY family transcriptional regulator [Gloeobacter kilaueensis]|uniref:Transcriptional regulator n=1 Tax=Gloeobacter kilaueensis (strain ATCC BAA-2537 / CCAP 1431/1 / ULC 316 / JS1) TaxID=1183438 RepID=U5QKY4_GLOK1|nr:BlaI/MecI/CopY family transcriptional regulator [Gloeobacter kilaueensis]AGY58279.1 transcriptional regulator [Gloeobacter kilaueensis JS1]